MFKVNCNNKVTQGNSDLSLLWWHTSR